MKTSKNHMLAVKNYNARTTLRKCGLCSITQQRQRQMLIKNKN